MKKNAKNQAPREGKKPFFARLLESQDLEHVAGGRSKPPPIETRKFPSDSDEVVTTEKFPSDSDEATGY